MCFVCQKCRSILCDYWRGPFCVHRALDLHCLRCGESLNLRLVSYACCSLLAGKLLLVSVKRRRV